MQVTSFEFRLSCLLLDGVCVVNNEVEIWIEQDEDEERSDRVRALDDVNSGYDR